MKEQITTIDDFGLTAARGDDAAFFLELFYRKHGYAKVSVSYTIESGDHLRLDINDGPLVRHVWATCGADRDALQAWCDHAGQFAYAQLAPAVFSHETSDPAAAQLLSRAAASLDEIALALDPQGRLPLAVCGSVGRRLADRLSPPVRSRLVDAADGPTAGALTLIRRVVDAQR